MMYKLIVFSIFVLLSVCAGQIVLPGQCDPNVSQVLNFDIERFLGTWYEVARTDSPNHNGDCAYIEFTGDNETDTLEIYSSAVNNNFFEEKFVAVTHENGTSNLSLNTTLYDESVDSIVFITDYDNFAVMTSCENISANQRRVHIWQFGRQKTYPNEMIPAHINTQLNNFFGISTSALRTIDHSDNACYILPVISPGEPIVLPGQCDPNLAAVRNFDAGRFIGVWHEISSYQSENSAGTCIRAEYSIGSGVVDVLNSQVINRTLATITGTATVISTDGSGKLAVVLNPVPGVTLNQELLVLATDYTNYAISYSCVNVNANQKRVYSWILSRTRQLNPNVTGEVDQVVNSLIELNDRYYQPTDQSDDGCFYFPDPQPNQPVIFRGQCNLNINAQANFDAVRYMGLWHDIESYPTAFQDGTCNNAFYTLLDGTVDVFNTQVINQTLDTINAVAVLASTDGSAKLLVTFPIAGTNLTVTTDYWVLSTDYDSYALVYSCTVLDADRMQVGSWKLSRTKQLTATANTAINNVVNDILVLDQRYYQARDQSREGCFYYPEPEQGVPVVFPGQCDETVDTVPNFNFSQFQGLWHEIQTYPKNEQTGQCINHQFDFVNNNLLNLVSSSVDDQFLSLTDGTVVFTSSNVSNAQLTIRINPNGTVIEIPYWILSTDYTDYALAYSCVNLNDDFRAVYSWKLSRTQQLSNQAAQAINNVIADVQVLRDVYYEDVDQTEDACFFLPEIPVGDPIILEGQCNVNINGMANLNLTRYLGRWNLIESYESYRQTGTCNIARYSLAEDGSMRIVNSEVRSQQLATVSFTAVQVNETGKLIAYISNRNFEYIVLDTDYDNYALVYGCTNLNTTHQRILSWKLGRENTFSQASNTAMNAVINTIQVLNNRYYYIVDRSSEGCFYFPTPDSTGPVLFRTTCNDLPVVNNFDAARYMGLWHDIESYPLPTGSGTCPNAFYSLNNGTVDVFNTYVGDQTLRTISGSAVITSTDGSARLNVTFNIGGVDNVAKLWVLATDYDNYAFAYSCKSVDEEYVQISSWKLSRTKALSAAAVTAINNVMNTIPVLDQRYYNTRDQTTEGCFYFPEPQSGVPVVFPGQCDNNITAVPNFSMSQFQGIWYEIEAYPKIEQPGQCINHDFSLAGTTTLNLLSTNVFNQTLDITNSNVVFASTDGSGRLSITISTDNGTVIIPYWVLSTDYNNYALAYSCVNINSDFRGVWSWKLSRTKQLTNTSVQAIDNTISTINVLDNMYYEPINQTDESCFYLPDLEPGEPVVFRGQCDESIRGIQNFQAARYLGRWFLIESYPTPFQSGTCNDATYTAGVNGTVVVFNTQVVNQTLATITGSAVASVDGSGRLFVTFPNSAEPAEYIILDTDYESYALVYSCSNLDSEYRQVWSWKLSRTNTLSQNATVAINEIVNSINVLDDRYFYTVDRSDAACFYFPPAGGSNVQFRGRCDETIPVVTNFDASTYMGLWHDIESYPLPTGSGTCPNAFYSLNDGTVDVLNSYVGNQALRTISGSAVITSTDGSAKLDVTFNIGGVNVVAKLWVLATDYDNYAFAYSCKSVDEEYVQISSWKLSRTRALSTAAATAINSVINTIPVLDQRYYNTRDQSAEGCFYFPEPQPGVPVVFPGQCDNNIAAVPSFSMSQFQGIWHEIEAYPKIEQPGQCINHQFSLAGTNTLNLVSNNVFNQTLDITNSNVVFASTDGSGRLSITISTDNGTVIIPYWVLSTDYNNYALAYSCVNINSDYRGVWSWKLSRTKQLTTNSVNAINNAIANIPVLDNRYYEPISQTDESCFYLPDLAPGEPVVFVGQCDQNIPVMQNFNAARYLGRWRLIESYPSNFQSGTCNEATYSLANDGSIIVHNTQVINESLTEIFGSAVLTGVNGSAKLTVTFPSSPAPIELWILDTDYETYTLVYSCVNLNSEQRRVWSWKMSRTNTLSVTATNTINQVVNSINVLDDRYFVTVDRSAAGCFYFPPLNPNATMVFRGQCDENLSVVTNFNPTRYAGLWYDIESYPAAFQLGTCSQAEYTLNSAGGVDVVNSQVLNQVRDIWVGTAVLASNDSSAKLDVTFEVNGINITTNYWVLATDYDSYSLVYSCRNVDDYYREVFSWKLSRQRNLTAAANININNAMSNVQVLSQDYFLERGHSEEDCFYYPDNFGGDVILDGQCVPDGEVAAVTNFNLNAFAGTWHEISRFPSGLQTGECASTEYTAQGTTGYGVIQTIVYEERQRTVSTQATVTGGRGVIRATIDGVPFDSVYVLATDYNEFALTYACRNLANNTKQIYSWKLGRSRSGLSQAANTVIDQVVFNNIDLFEGYYQESDQGNAACFHYPVFDTLPGSIVLPGPCNDTIRGIPNFNAEAYLGRWIEIAKYPQPNQLGECHRAEYSLGANRVDVSNTQVINETLLTQLGFATVASTDGSGQLTVTFVVNGVTVTANYYILATDYTSYALVYSCRNLANGDRQVSSWQLSRTTTLSPQAIATMEPVIRSTQGLIDEYYVNTSQSDEDCFYVPEVNAYAAPRFRGQCENITGLQGFEPQRFLGWWHEIERYPADGNVGECISSQYSTSGSTYQVVDSSVINGIGSVDSGTAIISSDGRLRRVFDGGNRYQDVWVLATDYETYALLYSCENVNDEYRRVWSAKHSKVRSLTPAGQAAMAPAIAENRVLHPQFYQPVDQSDAACFFYPAQTGDQVVIPGQCDENIPVVRNFDVNEYAGTWHDIEKYDPVQSSCIGTRLTVNEEGSLTVLNYEVINGELTIVEGSAVVTSTDGTARLAFSLPVAGTNDTVTTTMFVLNTDYESYALTYNCVNVNSFQRAVRAWKLSRERTLGTAGNTAINNLITERQELHQPYFNRITQSENCEEPSSSYLVKSSIIVMLVCAILQFLM